MLIKNELIAGVLIALASFAWICLEFVTGLQDRYIDYHPYITNIAFLIPIIGIHWALKKRYYSLAPSEFQIKDGLISGVIVSLVTAALSIPLLSLFFSFINPDFFNSMISASVKRAMLNGESAVKAIQEGQEYFNYSSYLIQAFTGALIFGLLISLIVSFRLVKSGKYKAPKKK